MAMEDLDQIEDRFDVVTSSLVFDYIEDFEGLMKKIYRLMNDDAVLVFSTSHPMATAYNGKYPRFTRNKSGERLYANICDYADEGRREIYWVVNGYELYHRTLSSMLNGMISAGFRIEECHESAASPELLKEEPSMFGGTRHRPDFIFFRCSRA